MLGVLVMLWLMQIVLLSAYFKEMKITQVKEVSNVIEESIENNQFSIKVQISAVQNNVCGLVYNSKGQLLYQVDALGLGCVLNSNAIGFTQKIMNYTQLVDESPEKEFALTVTNSVIQQDMIIFGKKLNLNFGSYYIFLNSSLLPIDSTISILQQQFIYVTIIVFVLFSIVSLIISSRLSKPIINMKKEAIKLAHGNYDVKFEKGEFTEFTELAETLNYTSEELKKMDELRKDLIANVSHDIKTPLTMIKAYAEMIKDISGDNKKKREQHLDVILDEVNHLDHLVQDMTQLSQFQSNVVTLQTKNFNVVDLVNESLRLLDGLIKSNKIQVQIFSPKEVIVIGDPLKIKQVLINFINNAIKFIGKDNQLVIQILCEEETVRIEVIDHGIGISSDDLPYIWDRYFKIDKHHHRNVAGTGLGLSIASAILKSHGCNFGVTSELEKGSVFWFEMKYAKKPEHVL
ncbi:MAG TPA: HAMP domain-containing sensor histidine kinase [Erysipelotrichaceae bacterium]|nr:HAMP domain-containing sensor histidine kinase [Erysipelotrichaceae bacterium]